MHAATADVSAPRSCIWVVVATTGIMRGEDDDGGWRRCKSGSEGEEGENRCAPKEAITEYLVVDSSIYQAGTANNVALLDAAGPWVGPSPASRELPARRRAPSPSRAKPPHARRSSDGANEGFIAGKEHRAVGVYVVCGAHGHHHHVVCIEYSAEQGVLEELRRIGNAEASARPPATIIDRELGALPALCRSLRRAAARPCPPDGDDAARSVESRSVV